jgi:hypothetical protein
MALASSPVPADGFRPAAAGFVGPLPDALPLANTAVTWGGHRWSVVLLPLPVERYARLKLLIHESFHRIQPALGLYGADPVNAHLDGQAGRVWMRMELRALARALRAADGEAASAAVGDALLFRAYRHALLPGSDTLEAALERQEGLAEYTGATLALAATGETRERVARDVENAEAGSSFVRSFAYATGPSLGMLLDRRAPGWRRDPAALRDPAAALARAMRFRAPSSPRRRAEARARGYGHAAVAADEAVRSAAHRARLARYEALFARPVLRFPAVRELNRVFDPGNVVSLGGRGTVYPTGVFNAEWGRLEVGSVGALLGAGQTILVPAPEDPRASPPRGPGWTLQLAPGWEIRPWPGRPGDYEVARAGDAR